MAERCIAYHCETRARCGRRVGRSASLPLLKLCRAHGRNPLITLMAWSMSRAERESLARGRWDRIEVAK